VKVLVGTVVSVGTGVAVGAGANALHEVIVTSTTSKPA
jgi:hypothetical protein